MQWEEELPIPPRGGCEHGEGFLGLALRVEKDTSVGSGWLVG